jgi:hypothetical protein
MWKLFARRRESLGLELPPGARHYRAYVGHSNNYDLIAAMTFNLLTTLGLRQGHTIVDVGCGSLRIGRLVIPYLNAGNYVGIEPHRWLVEEGIKREVGADLIRIKKPRFYFSDSPKVLTDASYRLDFAVAQSVFSHCGPDLIRGWLLGISAALAPSGALLATFLPGEEDYAGEGWVYPECVQYTLGTIYAAWPRRPVSHSSCWLGNTLIKAWGCSLSQDSTLRGSQMGS